MKKKKKDKGQIKASLKPSQLKDKKEKRNQEKTEKTLAKAEAPGYDFLRCSGVVGRRSDLRERMGSEVRGLADLQVHGAHTRAFFFSACALVKAFTSCNNLAFACAIRREVMPNLRPQQARGRCCLKGGIVKRVLQSERADGSPPRMYHEQGLRMPVPFLPGEKGVSAPTCWNHAAFFLRAYLWSYVRAKPPTPNPNL